MFFYSLSARCFGSARYRHLSLSRVGSGYPTALGPGSPYYELMKRTAGRSRSSASFRPDGLIGKKGNVMSKKVVKRTVNIANPPALTKKQKAELAALAA
jgi:hypothetical protein